MVECQPPKLKLKLTSFFSTGVSRHIEDNQLSTYSSEPVFLTYSAKEPNNGGGENEGTKKNIAPEQSDATAAIPFDHSSKNTLHGINSSGTYPTCWSAEQYNYFMTTYPWMFCENESIGCNFCKKVKSLGLELLGQKVNI